MFLHFEENNFSIVFFNSDWFFLYLVIYFTVFIHSLLSSLIICMKIALNSLSVLSPFCLVLQFYLIYSFRMHSSVISCFCPILYFHFYVLLLGRWVMCPDFGEVALCRSPRTPLGHQELYALVVPLYVLHRPFCCAVVNFCGHASMWGHPWPSWLSGLAKCEGCQLVDV